MKKSREIIKNVGAERLSPLALLVILSKGLRYHGESDDEFYVSYKPYHPLFILVLALAVMELFTKFVKGGSSLRLYSLKEGIFRVMVLKKVHHRLSLDSYRHTPGYNSRVLFDFIGPFEAKLETIRIGSTNPTAEHTVGIQCNETLFIITFDGYKILLKTYDPDNSEEILISEVTRLEIGIKYIDKEYAITFSSWCKNNVLAKGSS